MDLVPFRNDLFGANPEVVEEISQGFINSMFLYCICGILLITLRGGDVFTVNRLIMEA